jgi:hypothetical protein
VTRAQQLEIDAVECDLRTYHAEKIARRVPIAGLDELGEMFATVGMTDVRLRRVPGAGIVVDLWTLATRDDGPPRASGAGETLIDALEAMFLDLAQTYRVDAQAIRARAAHAA